MCAGGVTPAGVALRQSDVNLLECTQRLIRVSQSRHFLPQADGVVSRHTMQRNVLHVSQNYIYTEGKSQRSAAF